MALNKKLTNLEGLKVLDNLKLSKITSITELMQFYAKTPKGTQVMIDWDAILNAATPEETVEYLKGNLFSISTNVTNGESEGATCITKDSAALVKIISDSRCTLPTDVSEIIVTNATINSYDKVTGDLIIKNPTNNVTITTTCPPHFYNITSNISSGRAEGATQVPSLGQVIVKIVANTDYAIPVSQDDIEVINATVVSYNNVSGELVLANATSNVTITCECIRQTVFNINTTIKGCNLTGSSSIAERSTVTCTVIPENGYLPPLDVEVAGADFTYNYKTGELILSNPTQDVEVVGVGRFTPLCFIADEDNAVISYTADSSLNIHIQTSIDNNVWSDWDGSDITLANREDKIYVRNLSTTLSESYTAYFKFGMRGLVSAKGNVMSMINHSSIKEYCFTSMFRDCTSLNTVPHLPSTNLAANCYSNMFNGCSTLTEIPVDLLPATILEDSCYMNMFTNCARLVNVPTLPALVLADSCYESMFENCQSLRVVSYTLLQVTQLKNSCYKAMFKGCSLLSVIPELPATELVNGCYYQMFADDVVLKVNENEGGIPIFTCPSVIPTDTVVNMFENTAGSFKGTPTAGNVYNFYE